MTAFTAYDSLDAAVEAISAAAPGAYELPALSRLLGGRGRVLLHETTGTAFVAWHDDGDGLRSVIVNELRGDRLSTIEPIDEALDLIARDMTPPPTTAPVAPWSVREADEILTEYGWAYHSSLGDAAEAETVLRARIDRAQRRLTILGAVRAHLHADVVEIAALPHPNGARAHAAEALGISPQALSDSQTAAARRWSIYAQRRTGTEATATKPDDPTF
ncbi:MAG TPA: hypothetical protein VGF17_06100 [Phytomonospora sp.]